MSNKEKVTKGLECHYEALESSCDICPYKDEWTCQLSLCKDAFTLLKEQEAKTKHCNDIALEYAKEVFRLQTLLKEQPNIVRCKDCKHSCGRGRGMYCQFIECEKTGAFHKEDWFCANGEKKEDR